MSREKSQSKGNNCSNELSDNFGGYGFSSRLLLSLSEYFANVRISVIKNWSNIAI